MFNDNPVKVCLPNKFLADPHEVWSTAQTTADVYILDSQIDIGHRDFQDRIEQVPVFQAPPNIGHGTHVAGVVGSSRYGIAKYAKIYSHSVLDESGYTKWSNVLTALARISKTTAKPAVINLSIAGTASSAIDYALREMTKRGWKIVVSAGNNAQSACNYSPAREPSVVTVGGIGPGNEWAPFSNFGPCVDILAPAVNILSSWPGNRAAYMSGTSAAAPLVAGAWALFNHMTRTQFINNMTTRIRVTKLPRNTTNRVLLSEFT
jgi:serine protease